MRLSETVLKKLIKGTFLATLLLAAQEGGKPLNEAAWILVGATLTTVIDAYASHISGRHDGDVRAYIGSLSRGIVEDSPRTIASLPTVLLLVLAAILHWNHDHRNPDGSVTVGYETIVLNINVVLLFIFGILAAHRSGSSIRGTILFGLLNASLGWLIVTAELQLE
jgi:Na+/phosphate symporter